jgi:hypothetical protein
MNPMNMQAPVDGPQDAPTALIFSNAEKRSRWGGLPVGQPRDFRVGSNGAVDALNAYLGVQAQVVNVITKEIHSRGHVRVFGVNPITGQLVPNGAVLPFFSEGYGQLGTSVGFNRKLTRADASYNFTNQFPKGIAFVAESISIDITASMPARLANQLMENCVVTIERQTTKYELGRAKARPYDQGAIIQTASTTVPGATITSLSNGGRRFTMPLDALFIVPPGQQVGLNLYYYGEAGYATTDGLPLGGGNALIPNDGTSITADGVDETAGYLGIVLAGQEISLPGN